MSWDAYVTNLTANGALEYAAIIGLDGNIWASNLGVAVLPTYNTEVPDEKNPDATTHVAYDEKTAFVHALTHQGNSGNKAGVRINNQKYYSVQFDGDSKTWYLKKVIIFINFRIKVVHVLLGLIQSLFSLHSPKPLMQKMEHHRTLAIATNV